MADDRGVVIPNFRPVVTAQASTRGCTMSYSSEEQRLLGEVIRLEGDMTVVQGVRGHVRHEARRAD